MNKQYITVFLLMINALNAMEKEHVPSFENLAIDNQKAIVQLLLHIDNAMLFNFWVPIYEDMTWKHGNCIVKSPDGSSYTNSQIFRGISVYNTLSKKQIAFFSHKGLLSSATYTSDGSQLRFSKRNDGYDWLFCYDLIPFYISSEQKNYIQTLRHYIFAKTILDQRKTEFGLNEDGYSTWQAIKGAFGAYFKLLAHTDGKRWILKQKLLDKANEN